MKKARLFAALILVTLFLIPFGTLTVAQSTSYIGVEEEKTYEWKVDLDIDGLDAYLHNIEGLIAEIGAKVSLREGFLFPLLETYITLLLGTFAAISIGLFVSASVRNLAGAIG